MAEQAQRRAPVGQPLEEQPENNHALEELRQLIVAPEQEGLQKIRERLDSIERRAEDVSSVVAEAIQMRREQGDDRALAEALAPTIQETLRDSVRRDPQTLADALFPVMGPAIRKSISEALRSMVESFNEALEHSLSVRGIQWRIEALRTGKPFAEIVLMHSLLFRAEQIFLIHRETGLVLSHVVAPAVATQDPDMIAGMLSAIQQFVRDSFNSSRAETLDSMEVGELRVWIEEGPHAVIAAVIRGHAPSSYRLAMKEALEEIEKDYSAALDQFQGDAAPFRAAGDLLTRLLESQFREKDAAKKKPKAFIAAVSLVAAIILGWAGYSTYLLWQWSRFLSALRQQPGIVVISYGKSGGRYHVQGFRDPLAPEPEKLLAAAGFDPKSADLELLPFYSVDDSIVLRRTKDLLHAPESVKLYVKHGQLRAEGAASAKWIAKFNERAPWIAGVNGVDTSKLQDADVLEFEMLKSGLQAIILVFPLGRAELEPGQEAALAHAEKNLGELLAQAQRMGGKAAVEIVGHTDVIGGDATNLSLSRQRADQILAALRRSGLPTASVRARGAATSEPLHSEDTEEGRRLNRSVTFKVAYTPAPVAN
jgi:outer membrane protein OmpA-like peptidoglycan-associated protein